MNDKICDTCSRLKRAQKPGDLDMCMFFDVHLYDKFRDPDKPCVAWRMFGTVAFIKEHLLPKDEQKIDDTSWLLVTIDDFHNTKDPEKKERLRSEIIDRFGLVL